MSGLEKPSEQKKVIQQITVIKPPPPPPEPPPPEEQEEIEEFEEETPEEPEPLPDDAADEPPAGEDLGVDADAVAGGDSFGLQARKGGRGLLAGGSAYGNYLKSELNKIVLRDKELNYLEYEVVLELKLNSDGSIANYDLDLIKGSELARDRLNQLLSRLDGFGRGVPFEERDKIFRLKINSVL